MSSSDLPSSHRRRSSSGLKVASVFGYASALICIGFTGLASLLYGYTLTQSTAVVLMTAGGIATACCLGFGWWMGRRSKRIRLEQLEQDMLQVVRQLGGRTTAVELAAASGQQRSACREFLEEMNRDGDAEMQVTPEGNLVYSFPGIATDSKQARDPMHRPREELDELLRAAEVEERERRGDGPPPPPLKRRG